MYHLILQRNRKDDISSSFRDENTELNPSSLYSLFLASLFCFRPSLPSYPSTMASMMVSSNIYAFRVSFFLNLLPSFTDWVGVYGGKSSSNRRSYCWKKGRTRHKGKRSWLATSTPARRWPMLWGPRSDLEEWTSWSTMIRVTSPFLTMGLPSWSSSTSYIQPPKSL